MSRPQIIAAVEERLYRWTDVSSYAVLDGARVPDLLDVMDDLEPESVCLYSGELEPDLEETAPYLVKLERESPFSQWVLSKGWGNAWGIFAQSSMEMHEVRKQFRKLLMVMGPDDAMLYFRFYDPRVLREFMPTCTAEEHDFVVGDAQSLLCESEDGQSLLVYNRIRDLPRRDQIPLVRGAGELRGSKEPASRGVALNGEADSGRPVLKIRRAQWDALSLYMTKAYIAETCQGLRQSHGELLKKVKDDDLRSLVSKGINDARAHGIEYEDDVRVFLELRVEAGPDFDSRELWAAATISDARLDGTAKAKELRERWTDELARRNVLRSDTSHDKTPPPRA